jgi:hypothetical protein
MNNMNTAGVIISIIASVIAIIGATYYMLNNIFNAGKSNQKFEDIEKKVNEYSDKHSDCERRFITIETTKANNLEIQRKFDEIILQFKILSSSPNKSVIINPFSEKYSPVILTERGRNKAHELGFFDKINDNWENISELIDKDITNPYDIQEFYNSQCLIHPENILSEENIDLIKKDAYKEGLNVDSYMQMASIIIRDRYFEENNINVSDVDKYVPDSKQ